jgi:DUF1365 family protein
MTTPAPSASASSTPAAGAPHASCLYEGSVRHRRHGTPNDELRYRMFMVYLDLDELPGCFDGHPLWSARRAAPAWFRRADHLGDPHTPLAESVRELVAAETGRRPQGPIRLLTHLRYFGHCFNPVSFYYCYDAAGAETDLRASGGALALPGARLSAVVAHVTNTPWGESHAYVIGSEHAADHGSARTLSGSSPKQLHVSPLMGMQHTYQWRASEPGERLSVHIESHSDSGQNMFDATLALRRRELSSRELTRALTRYPLLTLRITARIYGHALRLRLRGARYFPHPQRPQTGERAPCA